MNTESGDHEHALAHHLEALMSELSASVVDTTDSCFVSLLLGVRQARVGCCADLSIVALAHAGPL